MPVSSLGLEIGEGPPRGGLTWRASPGFRPIPSNISPPGRPSSASLAPIQSAEFPAPLWDGPRDPSQGPGCWVPLLDPVLSLTVGYDRTNKQHHSLLLCLLMTSCDLSDQTKGWKTTRKIAVSATPSWEGTGCTPCLALCGSCSLHALPVLSSACGGDRSLDHLR